MQIILMKENDYKLYFQINQILLYVKEKIQVAMLKDAYNLQDP